MRKECGRVLKILNRYHDGEASPEEAAIVERHLEACHSCRKQADALQTFSRCLRGAEPLRASGRFTAEVMKEIGKEAPVISWNAALPFIRRMAVAAVIVMMISFSFLAFPSGGGTGAGEGKPAEVKWTGFLSSDSFTREQQALLFGEGLAGEYERKIWTVFER